MLVHVVSLVFALIVRSALCLALAGGQLSHRAACRGLLHQTRDQIEEAKLCRSEVCKNNDSTHLVFLPSLVNQPRLASVGSAAFGRQAL